ncbi:two component transcriptional regulator, AraC family [Variovorax paradoxus B4]|uniref:Two component transcriptional regulator, AraC family n=1 Tax=Variovorax paradoxus B4 TaxID=1246301 RepID=T1XHG5_VARPD|nr:DNA-binding response regulator [Variovorax paradoxus]AGU51779.1 two component transcriptional regulator, AraC family [Variovorax paradoxus B4]
MSYWFQSSKPAHIMVIDDNVEELQVLLAALRGAGHRISLDFDALGGYRRAGELQPDLILLDAHLGATSGFEACRLLKADPTTAHIPVIFLTAGATLEERLTGLREGGVDYILKPFEPEEVLVRISVHLALARHGAQPPDGAAEAPRRPLASGDEAPHDLDRVIARAAQRLIESDLANIPPLPALAARVGTHEKRLTRAFRAHTGRTVLEFVREERLSRAQHLLAQTPLSIEDVAHAIGFSGAANFTTAFKERFGSTPAAYRRLGRDCACAA